MRRIPTAAAALALVALAGTACDDGDHQPPAVLPSGQAVVATLEYPGAFVSASRAALRTPALAVYSDGTVVADASSTLTIPTGEVATVLAQLRADLDGFPPSVPTPAGENITDVGTTTITIALADGREQRLEAYGLGYLDGFDTRLRTAWGRLDDLRQRALGDGAAFTSERVRLAAQAVPSDGPVGETGGTAPTPATQITPWPVGVPVPVDFSAAGVATLDLTDPAEVGAAVGLGDSGQRLRTAQGSVLWVEWRFLLPHE